MKLKHTLQYKQRQKKELSKLDAIEDAKILKYAQEKERIDKLRKEKEAKRFAERQAVRQRLIDEQTKYLEKMAVNEDTRIANQIAEREAKDAKIEQEKKEYQEKLLQECLLQCQQQKEKKLKEKQERIEAEQQMLQHINKQFDEYNKEEKAKIVKRRQDAIEIQNCLKQQIIDKKRREIIDAENDANYMTQQVDDYNRQKKELTEWANNKINEYSSMGLNVTHLLHN